MIWHFVGWEVLKGGGWVEGRREKSERNLMMHLMALSGHWAFERFRIRHCWALGMVVSEVALCGPMMMDVLPCVMLSKVAELRLKSGLIVWESYWDLCFSRCLSFCVSIRYNAFHGNSNDESDMTSVFSSLIDKP